MRIKIFALNLLLFSISFIKGQDYAYVPLVEEGTRWSYAFIRQIGYVPGDVPTPDYAAGYSTYQLKGDTTINGIIYKKLLDGCSGNYIAAMREENQRVFAIKEQEEEQILYDFNLQEGDWVGYLYQVTKIDTIQIGETKRKRFFFNLGYETWIEGIGALEDFFSLQGRLLDYVDQGINYQKKGFEFVYKTDKWYFNENDCKNSDIRPPLSYNPLKLIQRKGEIELQPDVGIFETGRVCVYSMQGNLLYMLPVKRNTNIIIPTSGFSSGTFIIQLMEEKTNKTWNRKVIIQ